MSKILNARIRVTADSRGRPRRFQSQLLGQVEIQQILDEWEEAGSWWQGESARRVYKVVSVIGNMYELHFQTKTGWRLYRMYD